MITRTKSEILREAKINIFSGKFKYKIYIIDKIHTTNQYDKYQKGNSSQSIHRSPDSKIGTHNEFC